MINKRTMRFDDPEAFFREEGGGWMKLSKKAAMVVIDRILKSGGTIWGIEGGIWHNPGFEARIDAITKYNYKLSLEHEESDNILRDYFANCPENYDTFIITIPLESS